MSRAVYIGGFGNGRASMERVANALEAYYEDVDGFTFSYAMRNPERISKAVHNVAAITHSAGMMALRHTDPNTITAFDAPVPTSKAALVGRTLVKTAHMHTPGIGIHTSRDLAAIATYDISATAEFMTHPRTNLGNLGAISRFDAVNAAIDAQETGIETCLIYTDCDEYFGLSRRQVRDAHETGVRVMTLSGIHDELVIRPADTLALVSDAL